jgi:hypothetical protein
MKEQTARKLRFLAMFGAYFGVTWFLWDTAFVYPIKLFVVLLHEISHGFAAIATGGEIRAIEINARQGGFCQCPGGNAFLTLSAGYLGSLLWGGLMILGAKKLGERSTWLTVGVGAVVGLTTLLYVRQPFAVAFGLAFGGSLLALGLRAGAALNRQVLLALGLTSCLYAVLDIKSDILDRPHLPSDARMLAELTGIPTVVWGALWIAAAVAFCIVLFRWAWKRA